MIARPESNIIDFVESLHSRKSQNKVHIVDDDEIIRDMLVDILDGYHISAEAFASGPEFLDKAPTLTGVVLLDLRMPGLDGLQTLRAMQPHMDRFVVVMMSGAADVASAVTCIRDGASEFLEKPFDEPKLLASIIEGQNQLAARDEAAVRRALAKDRLAGLTNTEMKVLRTFISGLTSQEAASYFRISKRTLETYRSAVYAKLGTNVPAELVKLAIEADLLPLLGPKHRPTGAQDG